jgi:trimeric autotransporter adhesin
MRILLFSCLFILSNASLLIAQIGVNTINPQATLDIFTSNPANPDPNEGLLIPRIHEFPSTNPSANQDGMIVFVTGNGSIQKGLYFWNNSTSSWVSISTTTIERLNDLLDGKSELSGSSIFIGLEAGTNDAGTNNRNVAIGFQSMQTNTSGFDNVALGWRSSRSLTGNGNVAIGAGALRDVNVGNRNIAIGREALVNGASTINNNIAIGGNALRSVETDNSVAVGYQALFSTTSGARNVGVGMETIFSNTTGNNNSALGHNAMRENITGSNNVAIGHNSLFGATSGNRNIAIGHFAMRNMTSVNDNVVIGSNAMANASDSNEVIAIGTNVLQNSADGSNKLAIGYLALASNTTSVNNTAIGYRALTALQTGLGGNTAIGERALESTTEGRHNVAIGWRAMGDTGTNVVRSTAIGYQAMRETVGGSGTAVGTESMRFTTTGAENAALGNRSLYFNTTGSFNTAVGHQALNDNTTANRNTAVGYQTLFANTTGQNNAAFGFQALRFNVVGIENTALGFHAGRNITGSRNVFIGREAGRGVNNDLNEINNSVFIGNRAGYFETNSNRLYIHNDSADNENALIYGEFDNSLLRFNGQVGVGRLAVTNAFEVNGEASKTSPGGFVANSDSRLKKNIQTINGKKALELILKMNGVTYEWHDQITGNKRPQGLQFGFIAQELKEIFPEKVTLDANGFYQTAYGDYDAILVQAIKELKQENDELKKEINALKLILKSAEFKALLNMISSQN